MINPIKYLNNLTKLVLVQATINRHRVYGESLYKLNFKPLLRRSKLIVLRVKINNLTCGMLVCSQRKDLSRITFIDLIWVNQKNYVSILPDTESAYYQVMYEVFMRWYHSSVVHPVHLMSEYNQAKIAVSINIRREVQIERFRRILTIYGFNIDPVLTMENVVFKAPYREKETITNVVYSRMV